MLAPRTMQEPAAVAERLGPTLYGGARMGTSERHSDAKG